jgi:hypothetical protein
MAENDHGARLSRAEAEIVELRKGQEIIFSKLDSQSSKMDALVTAMHELRAASGPAFKDILDIGTRVIVIFTAIVGGIIYLARGGNTAEMHALDARLTRIETLIALAVPKRIGPSPGAWVPDAQWMR